jgi:hypothetical protein
MRRWCAFFVVLAFAGACGSQGPQGPDYADNFTGTWFGQARYLFTDVSSGSQVISNREVQQPILASGRNSLVLAEFCTSSDGGPQATVSSATDFSVQPYGCTISEDGCEEIFSVGGGSGSLSSDALTLTLSVTGDVREFGNSTCPQANDNLTLSLVATRTDPRTVHLDPPTNLSVQLGFRFGTFALQWAPASEGYIQWFGATLDGGWELLNVTDIGADGGSGNAYLEVDELEEVRFAALTTNGYAVSAMTPEVRINSGFFEPYNLQVFSSPDFEEARLVWPVDHPLATGFEVERAEAQPGTYGPTYGTWAVLTTVSSTAGQYVDVPPGEGKTYAYRGRWVTSTVQGYPHIADMLMTTALYAPTNLVLTAWVSTVDLQWSNLSELATEIVVLRSDAVYVDSPIFAEIAHLGPSEVAYHDRVPYPGGYTYALVARGAAPDSTATSGTVVTLLDPSLGIDAHLVDLPSGSTPRRDTAGHWYVVSAGAVQRTADPGWAPHPLQADQMPDMALLLDSAEQPHVVYARLADAGPSMSILHDWFDGSAWHSEELASQQTLVSVPGGDLAWSLDPSDHPVAVLSTSTLSDGLRVVRWSGASFSVEHPWDGGTPVDGVADLFIATDMSGSAHLVASAGANVLYFENSSGWKSTSLSLGIARPRVAGILPGPSGIDVLGWNADSLERFVVHRDASTWHAPLTIGTSNVDIGLTALVGASLRSGSRPAALVMTNTADQLDFGEGWSPLNLSRSYPLGTLGFDKNGKFYALLYGGPGPQDSSRWVEYLER